MRSRTDKKLTGVCGGLAKYLGISSTLLRIIFVAAAFLSSSTFIVVYIILAFVIPKEPVSEMDEFKF
ncbi:MAG: PspC domain-containing protein [Balneolaceae bacterium]|nr:PspC domain-containing protein [Balneolaceae bacterium]